jgi:CheY-like chemotaxis protein
LDNKSKPSILIVEDDFENQKFLRILLKKYYDVEICDNAIDCFDLLMQKKIEIILMDISLKGETDGFQITRELRTDPRYKHIPIVGLSAHAFQRDKDNAYAAGIDIFLTKPVEASYLIKSLTEALEESKD